MCIRDRHEAVAERVGVSREKQADIVGVEYQTSPHYKPNEVAILDLCGHIMLNPENIPSTVWSAVKEHYDDGQIVEIVITIGAYLQVSKFGDALGVELEDVWGSHQPVLFAKEAPKSKVAMEHYQHFISHSNQ